MTKQRKIKISIAVIALIICISQISQTYAKYLETKTGDTDFNIAKWQILVNDKDITEATTMSSLITPVYLENENVAKNVIAPGTEGYFDLDINAEKNQVSFQYNINATNSENSSVTDLKITGYQLNNSTLVNTNESEIKGTINQSETNKKLTIRIYFKWLDGEQETMDNKEDTKASVNGETAKLKVNLSFTQIA